MTERIAVPITLDADDVERLIQTSTEWGPRWREHDGRFEHTAGRYDAAPSYAWRMAHWVGPDWAPVVLVRSWLDAHGYPCEVVWDLADGEDIPGRDERGDGYVVLTDWATPAWERRRPVEG